MNTTTDQAAFEAVGDAIGKLFVGAIRHAASTTPNAVALLVERFRADRSSVRAIVGLDSPGSVVFEWRDDRGEWRSAITLRGEGPDLRMLN